MLEDIVSLLQSSIERLEEFSKSVAAKDREKDMHIQEIHSKWEEKRHNLQDFARKYNDVAVKYSTQVGQVKVLINEKKSWEEEKST